MCPAAFSKCRVEHLLHPASESLDRSSMPAAPSGGSYLGPHTTNKHISPEIFLNRRRSQGEVEVEEMRCFFSLSLGGEEEAERDEEEEWVSDVLSPLLAQSCG